MQKISPAESDISFSEIHLFVFFGEHAFFVVLTFYPCFLLDQYKNNEMFALWSSISRPKFFESHYKLFHKINTSNWFLKALFEESKGNFFCRKYYRCEKFLTNRSEEKQHDFLKHYQKGGEILLEHCPIIKNNDGTITKFEIQYEKHKNSYDFKHPVK